MRPGQRQIPTIGLTGGIGAGKSVVAGILGDLGCLVCDSDGLGRAALLDPAIRALLVQWWGEDILDSAGEIDRSAVARIVFADPAERRRLEQLTHPWIEYQRREQFATAAADTVAFVIDAPLLLEAGLDAECDAVIFVDAPREVRLARVIEHRGWDDAEFARRERSQWPLADKRSRADYIVDNHADLDAVRRKIEAVLDQILAAYSA